MRLFIAEKPSLARAIAEALPNPHRRDGNCIRCGDSDVVAWCAGHILSMAPPTDYNPDYQEWKLAHLPIVPTEWKLVVSTPNLLKTIKALLQSASSVVHAGDPDREGQLLVDEVLEFLGYRGLVERILVRDLSPDAVRRALGTLEPNEKYRTLCDAALARQRADWLYGMNMTRLYTLLGKAGGYRGVLSVGRVQTPLLGLIVRRDLAIEGFKPTPFYQVHIDVKADNGALVRAGWQPGPGAEVHLDVDGRLLVKDVAVALAAKLQSASGSVTACESKDGHQGPPLPYSLADLQIDAAGRLGLTAEQTLQACQRLYEAWRLITYPRSDCAYLPEGHFEQAPNILAAISGNTPSLAPAAQAADRSLRSPAWNDRKVTAHHALIPTSTTADMSKLSDAERAVYDLIARRYLMQFYPPWKFTDTRLELVVGGERFVATGRQSLAEGWKRLLCKAAAAEASDGGEDEPDDAQGAAVPPLAIGSQVSVASAVVDERRTKPPKPFTDASLIAAMCTIARHVSSPNLKKILNETDGIGTPATRAAIIETLFERGYVERVKKAIRSTTTGRTLIAALPELATIPDLTAIWEAAIRAVQDGQQHTDNFLNRVSEQLATLIADGKKLERLVVANAPTAPANKGAPHPTSGRAPHRPRRAASR